MTAQNVKLIDIDQAPSIMADINSFEIQAGRSIPHVGPLREISLLTDLGDGSILAEQPHFRFPDLPQPWAAGAVGTLVLIDGWVYSAGRAYE